MPIRGRRLTIVLFHILLTVLSGWLALNLRFDFNVPDHRLHLLPYYLLIALAIKLPLYQLFGLNKGWWKYSSLSDAITIVKFALVAHSMIYVLHMVAFGFIPRSTLFIDFFLTIIFVAGSRAGIRMVYENLNKPKKGRRSSDKRVLIVGAGDCGIMLVKQMQTSERNQASVVGFLDDSPSKQDVKFLGRSVLGQVRDLPEVVAKFKINEVYIAIPTLRRDELQKIVDLCIKSSVSFKRVPAIEDILKGTAKVHDLREVEVEDLLGREPIQLDRSPIREALRDRVVLVTGAGGSIGSELSRQIALLQPKKLILLERSEYNLFHIERELKGKSSTEVVATVTDITDEAGCRQLFATHKPEFIYHAAAHKHVSLMEVSPREAVRNNVLGTWNISRIARDFGAQSFVMISTDKAVRPLSIMGYSKRMAELAVQFVSRTTSQTKFISVRFGNVLGSSGSVVEIFRQQLKRNEPLTVTDSDASRFFMTCPEAVELVLHAGVAGSNGEIYMLDMGNPVKIMDLARRMIQLSDPTGEKGYRIELTGLKKGEKLCEELYWEGEDSVASPIEKIFRLRTKCNTEGFDLVLADLLSKLVQADDESLLASALKSSVEKVDRATAKAVTATASPLQIVQ